MPHLNRGAGKHGTLDRRRVGDVELGAGDAYLNDEVGDALETLLESGVVGAAGVETERLEKILEVVEEHVAVAESTGLDPGQKRPVGAERQGDRGVDGREGDDDLVVGADPCPPLETRRRGALERQSTQQQSLGLEQQLGAGQMSLARARQSEVAQRAGGSAVLDQRFGQGVAKIVASAAGGTRCLSQRIG